jgi:surface polysaccharide O-acyltransferase-like enzyme
MDRRIDWLKVIACFMVVLLHISGADFHNFGQKWLSANFWDSLTRVCVPIFFMVSGATLLNKTEALSTFYRKRLGRVAIPLLFWSVFYLWWLDYNGVHTGNWLLAILQGPTMYHLWYFYALFGLYLFVPVMRRFYQASTQSEKMFFLAVWFLTASLKPTLQSLYLDYSASAAGYSGACIYLPPINQLDIYNLQYFGGYVGYMLLGSMLYECGNKGTLRQGIALFLLGSTATFIATYVVSKAFGKPCEFFYVYGAPFVLLAATGLFIALVRMRIGPSSRGLRIASDCTLGIYGLHPFIIDPVFLNHGLIRLTGSSWIDPLLAALGVFGVSFVIVYLGKRVLTAVGIFRATVVST